MKAIDPTLVSPMMSLPSEAMPLLDAEWMIDPGTVPCK
jgi:hypothetical protein